MTRQRDGRQPSEKVLSSREEPVGSRPWETVKKEDVQNEELLALSRQILDILCAQTDRARTSRQA